MTNPFPFAAPIVCALFAQVGGMDMAVAEKWASAKVVRYRVEGVHSGRVPVVHGDYEGKADVLDRVTLAFDWDNQKSKVLGAITVTDAKSQLSKLASDGTNCPPPQLSGEYEHFQSTTASVTDSGQIQIKGTRVYPAARVSNYPGGCSLRPIPGFKEEATLYLAGTSPQVLGMPNMPGPIKIAADRKSFTMTGGEGWSWTFTPALVQ